jgi:hypothetical protein
MLGAESARYAAAEENRTIRLVATPPADVRPGRRLTSSRPVLTTERDCMCEA